MDDWIRRSARLTHEKRVSTVYVCLAGDGEVIAIFAFGQKLMTSLEVSSNASSGLDEVPAVLLGRLALRADHQGAGHGLALLVEAMIQALEAARYLPARLFVVEAKTEGLAKWYAKQGLIATKSNPLQLYRGLNQIEKTLRRSGHIE